MGKINLDPFEEYLEAEQLDALIELWLAALDVNAITHQTYADRIRWFRQWWAVVGPAKDWQLTESAMQSYEVYLRTRITRFGRPMTYLTRYMTIRVVRQMFIWASIKGKIDKNYGLWLPFPAGDPSRRKAPKPEHLARLMLAAAESPQALRDQAIIAFLIGTGCRRSEVAGLRVEDLTILADGSGTATVTGKRTSANPTGVRDVGFSASTGKWLVRYLDETGITAGSLWPIGFWGHLGPQGVYQMVKRAIARAGLNEYIQGPHDLRRSFATILGKLHRDAPAWADLIRRQMGHKHYAQTTDYISDDAEDIRDQIVNPLDL
jgi:integrase